MIADARREATSRRDRFIVKAGQEYQRQGGGPSAINEQILREINGEGHIGQLSRMIKEIDMKQERLNCCYIAELIAAE